MSLAITAKDLIPLPTYRAGRDEYIRKMIQYKKNRRVKLADKMSLLFENKQTVLFQIQELVNSEDLTDPEEIEEYIGIYSGMLPGEDELSATLFIEYDDKQELEQWLVKLKGIERHLDLIVGEERLPAVFEEEHSDREFTTSVHYLKFPLTASAKELLQSASSDAVKLKLLLHHPNFRSEVQLPADHVASLQKDLTR